MSGITSSERRIAQRLEQEKLDADYLRWYVVPSLVKLPSLREEAYANADQLSDGKSSHAWGDMAIRCADWKPMDLSPKALQQRKLPFNLRKRAGKYKLAAAIQSRTMKGISKGQEFPAVTQPGVGPYACEGRRRTRGRSSILCGGDLSYAAGGD